MPATVVISPTKRRRRKLALGGKRVLSVVLELFKIVQESALFYHPWTPMCKSNHSHLNVALRNTPLISDNAGN